MDWVEEVADSKDARDYRRRVEDSETASMWQSLGFGPQYKAAYCMAACPAGDSVCGTTCVNEMTDAANCGSCGHACAAGLNQKNPLAEFRPLLLAALEALYRGTGAAAIGEQAHLREPAAERQGCLRQIREGRREVEEAVYARGILQALRLGR